MTTTHTHARGGNHCINKTAAIIHVKYIQAFAATTMGCFRVIIRHLDDLMEVTVGEDVVEFKSL